MSTEEMMDSGKWPVPCPHEGDKERCDACWASHSDATPYCESEHYKQLMNERNERKVSE